MRAVQNPDGHLTFAMAATGSQPPLGNILDSAATTHVFGSVDNPRPCKVYLQGEHSTRVINTKGNVGGLNNVLENKNTPGNLTSLKQLFTDGPWVRFLFSESDVIGIRNDGSKDLIASMDRNNLYQCRDIVTTRHFRRRSNVNTSVSSKNNHCYDAARPKTCTRATNNLSRSSVKYWSMVGSTMDTRETDKDAGTLRQMALPSPELVRQMILHKTIRGFGVNNKYLRKYRAQSSESRLRGSMTVPRYVASKRTDPKPARAGTLKYLDEIYCDSKELMEQGPNGERWMCDLIDRATGTVKTFEHKDWDSLSLLMEREVIALLDDARVNLGIKNPKIKRFYLDGHPTQVGRTRLNIADCQKMLQRHGIHVPHLPPGDHARMGMVERVHQTLNRMAITIFHEQGRGLPKSFFMYAYKAAAKIKDIWPQTGRDGCKSAFELRTGKAPHLYDIPYPAVFATGIIKDPDRIGLHGKKGFDHIGVVVDTGTNAPASRQLMNIWVPKTGIYLWRSGVVINDAFSTFGDDRIQRMRSDGVVHRHTDTSKPRVATRSVVHTASAVTTTIHPVPGVDRRNYLYAKRHGIPLALPYLCEDIDCKNNKHHMGFKTLTGLKRHYSSKLKRQQKRKDKIIQDTLDRKLKEKKDRADARIIKRAKQDAIAAQRRRNHRPRRHHTAYRTTYLDKIPNIDWKENRASIDARRRVRDIYTQKDNCRRALEIKTQNACIRSGSRERAASRRLEELNKMQRALNTTDYKKKNLQDYVLTDEENALQKLYESIPYTVDKSKSLSTSNDFTTFRAILGIGGSELDARDMLQTQRHPHEMVHGMNHSNHGNSDSDYTRCAAFTSIGTDGRVILTEENADRFTPVHARMLHKNPFYKEWMDAMQKEIDVLNSYKCFEFVKLDKSFKRITLRWVFKIKFRNGKLDKFKARLVARGFLQKEGKEFDPDCISAPVARAETIKIVMAEGVKKRHYFGEFDVKSAYLLSVLTENVYAVLPVGIAPGKGYNSLKIVKSLYGLRQAGYNWNKKFVGVLKTFGFEQSTVDPCLLTYSKGTDIIRVCLWVDDGLVSTNNERLWKRIQEELHKETPLSHHGPLDYLLGMKIFYNRRTGIMRISQKSKIVALLERYKMEKCYGEKLPLPYKSILESDGPSTPEEERQVANKIGKTCGGHVKCYADVIKFCRSVINTIGHMACWARPDVYHAVFSLARYQANPSVNHYNMLKHLLRYLRGTQDLTLTFGSREYEGDSPLVCMVDSNYTGTEGDSCYSTSGYCFFYYGCCILVNSKKQTAISKSTCEAELIAASHCIATGVYLRRLLISDFGLDPNILTPVGEDNQGCIGISRSGGDSKRARHVRVSDSYCWHECKVNKTHSLWYVRSRDNVADMFTKPADLETFRRLRWYLMGDAPNEEHKLMKRDQYLKYHWIPSDSSHATVEECWRMRESVE